ncbi:MAG: hypothetical protein ACTJLK_03465 [Anaplasma sp.]
MEDIRGQSEMESEINRIIRDVGALCYDGSTENICFRAVVRILTTTAKFSACMSKIDKELKTYRHCHSKMSERVNKEMSSWSQTSKDIAHVPHKIDLFYACKSKVRGILGAFHEMYHVDSVIGNVRGLMVELLIRECRRLRHDGVQMHGSEASRGESWDIGGNSGTNRDIVSILNRFSEAKHNADKYPEQWYHRTLLCFATERTTADGSSFGAQQNKVCICCEIPQGLELTVWTQELWVLGSIGGKVSAEYHDSLMGMSSVFVREITGTGAVRGFHDIAVLGDNRGCVRIYHGRVQGKAKIGGNNSGEIFCSTRLDVSETTMESAFGYEEKVVKPTVESDPFGTACGDKRFFLEIAGNNSGNVCVEGDGVYKAEVLIHGDNKGKVLCANASLRIRGREIDGASANKAQLSDGTGSSRSGLLSRLRLFDCSEPEWEDVCDFSSYVHVSHCDVEMSVNSLTSTSIYGTHSKLRLANFGHTAADNRIYDCRIFLHNSTIVQSAGTEISHVCTSNIHLEASEVSLPDAKVEHSVVDLNGDSYLAARNMDTCDMTIGERGYARIYGSMNGCRTLLLRNANMRDARAEAKVRAKQEQHLQERGLRVSEIDRGVVYVEEGHLSASCMSDVCLMIGGSGGVHVSYFKRGSINIGGDLHALPGDAGDRGVPASTVKKSIRFALEQEGVRQVFETGRTIDDAWQGFVSVVPLREDYIMRCGGTCTLNFELVEGAEVFAGGMGHKNTLLHVGDMKASTFSMRQEGEMHIETVERCIGEIFGRGVELQVGKLLGSRLELYDDAKSTVRTSALHSIAKIGKTTTLSWLRDGGITCDGAVTKDFAAGKYLFKGTKFSAKNSPEGGAPADSSAVIMKKNIFQDRNGKIVQQLGGAMYLESVPVEEVGGPKSRSAILERAELVTKFCRGQIVQVVNVVEGTRASVLGICRDHCAESVRSAAEMLPLFSIPHEGNRMINAASAITASKQARPVAIPSVPEGMPGASGCRVAGILKPNVASCSTPKTPRSGCAYVRLHAKTPTATALRGDAVEEAIEMRHCKITTTSGLRVTAAHAGEKATSASKSMPSSELLSALMRKRDGMVSPFSNAYLTGEGTAAHNTVVAECTEECPLLLDSVRVSKVGSSKLIA